MADKNEVIVAMTQDDFSKKITPIKVTDAKDLFLFQCPNCNNVHFRHAGYLETLLPYVSADKSKKVIADANHVMICVKCKHAYCWVTEQMYDVTDLIDVEAWEETEIDMQRMTGPGGDC